MRYPGKIRGKPGLLPCSTIVRTSHWNATLLPITLSPGLGCLLGTCRIQIWSKLGKHTVQNSASRQLWSKLRNRLRTITMLVIVGQKWVIMCPHVVQARITITVCTSNIWTWIHKRQQYRVETALLVDRSDSDWCLAAIAWASCCLFSVEQCLAAFAWASCCLLFIITFGTSESCFHNIYFNTITIFFSV